jgi:hypothetical protein
VARGHGFCPEDDPAALLRLEAGRVHHERVGLDLFPEAGVEFPDGMLVGAPPSFTMRSLTSGTCRALMISRFRRSTMSRGVFAGSKAPNQKLYALSGKPASTVVGTSGSSSARRDELTAIATSFPSRIKGIAGNVGTMKKSTRPAMISVSASAGPLNGMCWAAKPARSFKSSAMTCEAVPGPTLA